MVRQGKFLIVIILFFLFSTVVFGKDKKTDSEKDKKLRDEILAVYKFKGEEGLRDFVKDKKDTISNKFIVDFAEWGVKERKDEWPICLILAEEKKDEKTAADVYFRIGVYFMIKDRNRALDYFDEALSLYVKIKDICGQGNVFRGKGRIYFYEGKLNIAMEMYNKALYFFEKARRNLGQGDLYMEKGKIYLRIDDYSRAIEMFDKALYFYEKAGHPKGIGNVYFRKGLIYFYSSNNKSALKMYEKALTFFKKADSPIEQGNVYLCIGQIYERKCFNSRALEMYNKALYFYEKNGNTLGQGNIYNAKGKLYVSFRNISKAISMYNKALTCYKKMGEYLGQGNMYLGMGVIYYDTGDYDRSLEMHKNALDFYKKSGAISPQGNVYRGMGLIYFKKGDKANALEMYKKALYFFKKEKDNMGLGNVYLNKGMIYFQIGLYSKALEMSDKALHFFKEVESSFYQGLIYLRNGVIYSNYENNLLALKMYEKAIDYFKKSGDIESEAYALHGKGQILTKQGKKDEALSLFKKVIFNLERVRKQILFSKIQNNFMERVVYGLYEETTEFMLENKYYDKGFTYAESMKARVFLDKLAEGLVRLDKGIEPEIKQKRDNLVSKLSILSKEIAEAAGKKDKKKLKELKEQRTKVESKFEDLLVKIRLKDPLYASVRYPELLSVKELRKKVLKKGELILRYFVSSGKVYLFLVSKKKFKIIVLDAKKTDVDRMVNRYLLSIKAKDSKKLFKYGQELYQSLFKPVEASLKGKKNIIIVPDGQLATIPFESFVIDNDQSSNPVYLLEKYRIKYIQSASVLATMRKLYKRTGKTKHFIGFGDPVYDYENFKKGLPEKGSPDPGKGDEIKEIHRGKYDREGGLLDRLQGSGQEVEAISGLFKKQNQKCVVHLREQATEENAKSLDLKEFDYIHFSCHGILGDGFQSLVLSQIPKAKEDGYLTLNEIMNCDYNAKLVVLSACKTGSGKLYRGEGVAGLTRAVMYAGTPAVVASLWNVQDIATKELMVRFYKNMLEKGMKKEEALRQAKLDVIKEGTYASPYYWGAFVMYGE